MVRCISSYATGFLAQGNDYVINQSWPVRFIARSVVQCSTPVFAAAAAAEAGLGLFMCGGIRPGPRMDEMARDIFAYVSSACFTYIWNVSNFLVFNPGGYDLWENESQARLGMDSFRGNDFRRVIGVAALVTFTVSMVFARYYAFSIGVCLTTVLALLDWGRAEDWPQAAPIPHREPQPQAAAPRRLEFNVTCPLLLAGPIHLRYSSYVSLRETNRDQITQIQGAVACDDNVALAVFYCGDFLWQQIPPATKEAICSQDPDSFVFVASYLIWYFSFVQVKVEVPGFFTLPIQAGIHALRALYYRSLNKEEIVCFNQDAQNAILKLRANNDP